MALWTSTSTRNLEADLVSFDGTTAIFRINGLPKKNDVTKFREAYEQFYGTKEYWEYYRKHIAPGMIQRNPFNSEKSKTELDKLIEKARWENEHSWFYRLFHRWKD